MSTVVLFHLNTVRHVKCVRKMRWKGMWYVWRGEEVQTGFGGKIWETETIEKTKA
jgi:hypothetical protein